MLPPDAPQDFGDVAFSYSPLWLPLVAYAVVNTLLSMRAARRRQRKLRARRRWRAAALVVWIVPEYLMKRVHATRALRARRRWRVALLVVSALRRLRGLVDAALERPYLAQLAHVGGSCGGLVQADGSGEARAAVQHLAGREPYRGCLLYLFDTFSTPTRSRQGGGDGGSHDAGHSGGEDSDCGDAWDLRMRLETEVGLGWLALCDAWRFNGLAARQVWAVVHGQDGRGMDVVAERTDGEEEESEKEEKDQDWTSTGASGDGVGASSGLVLAQFLEAVAWAAALANPYGRPPYQSGRRLEKVLRAWLDAVLVPHARRLRHSSDDVLPTLRAEAGADASAHAVLDALVQERSQLATLFERFSEPVETEQQRTARRGGSWWGDKDLRVSRGVRLSRFVDLALALWPAAGPLENAARYRQVAEAAFVRALPRVVLHGTAFAEDAGAEEE